MGIGTSLFLIAVGAILDFGINVSNTQGINIHTIGVILMVVGAIGVVLSMVFWGSWGGFHSGRGSIVVDDTPRRRVVRDEIV